MKSSGGELCNERLLARGAVIVPESAGFISAAPLFLEMFLWLVQHWTVRHSSGAVDKQVSNKTL